jgi:hypothetical protein
MKEALGDGGRFADLSRLSGDCGSTTKPLIIGKLYSHV